MLFLLLECQFLGRIISAAAYKVQQQPMFQSRTEKGLFTFYWEQYQAPEKGPHNSSTNSSTVINIQQQLPTHTQNNIEEKQGRQNRTHQLRNKKKTQQLYGHLIHSASHKENLSNKISKEILTIDLSPNFSKQISERAFKVTTNNKSKELLKRHCELPTLPKQDSDGSKDSRQISKNQELFDKLLKGQQSLQPSRFNLQIGKVATQNNVLKRQTPSTRTKKVLRSDLAQKKINRTERNKNFDCNCLLSDKQPVSYRFPKLTAHPKLLKKQKEPYILEKVILERQAIERNSSVITLSIDSHDEYKERWERKKEEFLKILSRSMDHTVPS